MERVNYQSTKFWQTNAVILTSFVLVCAGMLETGGYVTLTIAALGNYAYHDVKQKGIK